MDLKLKVCGMRDPENILELVNLAPDFMGFIFYDKSQRFVHDLLPSVLQQIPESITKTGVFVNETLEGIKRIVDKYQLDLVQLHGNEAPEFCEILRDSGIKVIKVFSIDNDFKFELLNSYSEFCEMFLFDTKFSTGYGGHGFKFDWSLLKKYELKVPFLLAGGIDINDLTDLNLLDGLPLIGIDVNSKFELSAGLKDIQKLEKLKSALNSFNQTKI